MLIYGLENDPDFQHIDAQLLVSCPENGLNGHVGGPDQGGLFLLDFKQNTLKKLYTGGCTGMVCHNDKILVATNSDQLITFNHNFEVIRTTQHKKLEFHGMMMLGAQMVLIVETAINAIGCYEFDSLKRVGEIRFNPSNQDVHHINDIWIDGNRLYVSMFSPGIKWGKRPMQRQGAITAIDLTGFDPYKRLDVRPDKYVIAQNLYKPHSVMLSNGKLAYCDSMLFRIVIDSDTIVQFPGFTRGLAIVEDLIMVGQSRMRHFQRIPQQFSNCCLDGGVHLYNRKNRISRFVPLPANQVYQILVY